MLAKRRGLAQRDGLFYLRKSIKGAAFIRSSQCVVQHIQFHISNINYKIVDEIKKALCSFENDQIDS